MACSDSNECPVTFWIEGPSRLSLFLQDSSLLLPQWIREWCPKLWHRKQTTLFSDSQRETRSQECYFCNDHHNDDSEAMMIIIIIVMRRTNVFFSYLFVSFSRFTSVSSCQEMSFWCHSQSSISSSPSFLGIVLRLNTLSSPVLFFLLLFLSFMLRLPFNFSLHSCCFLSLSLKIHVFLSKRSNSLEYESRVWKFRCFSSSFRYSTLVIKLNSFFRFCAYLSWIIIPI